MEIQISTVSPTEVNVTCRGPINEESDHKLRLLEEQLRSAQAITFDFDAISSVDSLGVRAWVQFLRSLQPETRKIRFVRCNADIISQVNMIPSFSAGAEIVSFLVDYICPSCEKSHRVLIETSSVPKGTSPTNPKCPHCRESDMETEELEDEYFAFLNRRL